MAGNLETTDFSEWNTGNLETHGVMLFLDRRHPVVALLQYTPDLEIPIIDGQWVQVSPHIMRVCCQVLRTQVWRRHTLHRQD